VIQVTDRLYETGKLESFAGEDSSMCRASISILLLLLLGGMVAFAASFTPEAAAAQPGEMPCGGHHSCCVSPSPSYLATLPSTLNWHRSSIAYSYPSVAAPSPSPGSRIAYTFDARHFPSSYAFSTVLRI